MKVLEIRNINEKNSRHMKKNVIQCFGIMLLQEENNQEKI